MILQMSSRLSSLSIVEYFAEQSGHRCGYCKKDDTNLSHGMWSHTLSAQDYQDLIDRGWRRSGQYCYKPTMSKTCCPLYTIKCDAVNFKPSKSQKKVMRKFVNFIVNDKRPSNSNSDKMDQDVDVDESAEPCGEKIQTSQVEKKIKLKTEDINMIENEESLKDNRLDDLTTDKAVIEQSSEDIKEPVSSGMDPSKPKQGKAKVARREKWEKKVKEGKVEVIKEDQKVKSVEEFITVPKDANALHSFSKRLVKADDSDPDFTSSFSESLLVYQKYQMSIHGDTEDKCSDKQFRRFLCCSPLQSENGLGSFHLQYMIDSKIVAVGVIDVLPRCVSSVYLYYDPAFHFLSLGTLTSLMEICLVRELNKTSHPAISSYYLGFYIHNCVKMRYKGRYTPSYLCCPETFTWHPLSLCVPLLDKSHYSRLERDVSVQDRDIPRDIRNVGILYRRQATKYQVYQKKLEEDGVDKDIDKDEVEEYSSLVGDRLSKRMLLYRAS